MRSVAALYDVHGNLPALEAALAAGAGDAELIVFGGDIALGPFPAETLARVRELGPRAGCLRGDADRLMSDACAGRALPPLPPDAREAIEWAASRLDRRDRDFLDALPPTLTVTIDGVGEALFCHAAPHADQALFTAATAAALLRPLLDGITASIVVCGHTHMQFDRVVDGTRVVNAGSVGLPFGPRTADWLLLDEGIRLMRTEYDVAALAARVRETAYPRPDEFLHPMTAEEALRLFTRAGG